MSAQSYVNPAPRRRFGLRERLLVALFLGALATVLVAVVGWISFQRVVGSQQAIIRDTLPAADEAYVETVYQWPAFKAWQKAGLEELNP